MFINQLVGLALHRRESILHLFDLTSPHHGFDALAQRPTLGQQLRGESLRRDVGEHLPYFRNLHLVCRAAQNPIKLIHLSRHFTHIWANRSYRLFTDRRCLLRNLRGIWGSPRLR